MSYFLNCVMVLGVIQDCPYKQEI